MAKKYLDDTGMSYFWGKLKTYFQPKLVSGTNIKTINSTSLLGSGDIELPSPADYVVEQGTSGIWTYRKWASGIAECWGNYTLAYTSLTNWGTLGLGYTQPYGNASFPNGLFTSIPTVTLARVNGNIDAWVCVSSVSTSGATNIFAVRPAGTASGSMTISITAKGRWQ